jgi:hypothetical protein
MAACALAPALKAELSTLPEQELSTLPRHWKQTNDSSRQHCDKMIPKSSVVTWAKII